MSTLKFASDEFRTSVERMGDERRERLANGQRILSFGVKFLDDCLGGIYPNDLVLIGAKTGIGKTTLATLIATTNARLGRSVHYFALEAEPNEIERRAKFDLLSEMLRQEADAKRDWSKIDRLNYLDWYAGKLDDMTAMYERLIEEAFPQQHKTLNTFYRKSDFFAEQFEKMVLAIQDKTDLIVLDHLHYVDSDDSNENAGYKRIVKKVRDVSLSIGKPVVVVAHLRKGDRRGGPLVPEIEDFHGTSDVPKMATKAIILAPDFECPDNTRFRWSTFINPAKCRPDGTRTRYVGRTFYDSRRNRYEEEYDTGRLLNNGSTWEIVATEKLPRWAR